MNLFELFKPTKNLIQEGIDHPEDLIISQGSAGAERVLKDLASLQKDPSTVTVKWDGFPAVVFGRDKAGNLVFMDKHMYDKVVNGKLDFMSIKDYDASRDANRSDLWEKESVLRPALDKVIPQVRDQYWMGDLMWTGTPKTDNGYFVFKPNTVEYRVKIDDTPGRGNTLSDQIARSVGGIAVHTYIPGLGQTDQPLIGLKGLSEDAGIAFLVGEMKDKPRVAVNTELLANTKQIISTHKKAVDQFITDLTAMKGKAVITAMGPFITRMLEEDDISGNIVPRFLDFLKERLNETAQGKFLGANQDGWLYQEEGGALGLLGIWTMWAAITDLKTHIKQQIDTQQQGSEIIAITDGVNAHEGYVFGSGKDKLKLIDRLGFSRANFAKHKVSPEEIEQKSKMPMAAFCFGRMNPPTMGHGLVMQKTVEVGGENSFIFLSNSFNKDTDPVDPATKAKFISAIYPDYAEFIVTDYVQGPIYAANWLYNKGYRNMTFVAGSDRLGKEKGSIEKLLSGWNSGPIRSTDPAGAREHVVINFVSSGQRDPDAEGVTGYSGTKARQAAADGNEQQFQQFTGVGPEAVVNGKTLYQATREGMGIKDEQPTAQPAPVKQQPQAPQQNIQVTKKVPGKAPVEREVDNMNETPLKNKEDLQAKRKALQDIQMDKHTHKDPELKAELARRKAALDKEAKKMNLSESIINSLGILEEQEAMSRRLQGINDLLESDYCDACDRPMKDCICDETNEDKDPCWKDYKQLGMKTKNGKQVPNCVPKESRTDEIAGAFPSPSTRKYWADQAALSNAAEAQRQAQAAASANAERLKKNTEIVDKEQKTNYHAIDKEAVPFVPKNEARANTKAVRTGLAKREKRADPTMDAKKKSEQDAAWERLQAHMNKPENMDVLKRLATKESWTKLPSGDYQNSHTGVRTSKPPQKKKRGEKTGAEWDAIAKAKQNKEQGMAEGTLNEFAPDGFNGGDEGEEFNPNLAKMAYDEGFVKGAGLADGATLERAMSINDWDKHDGGMYKQYFAKGFKKGRLDKINFNNKQYNLNLILNKDGSISHGEQGVAESIIRSLSETPIEMDPQNPNDPMVMPPGLNPGKLSYRKSRAASQLADLARMAAQANEKNSAIMWDSIVKHFPELETNIRSIQHGQDELEQLRRKGGIKSRGIDRV